MSDQARRVDLRFGDFALSVQGFDDPVRPMRQVLRLVQRVVEETPEIATMRLDIDEEAVESMLEDLKARLGLPEERLEVTPGLIIATHPDAAELAPEAGAGVAGQGAAAGAPALGGEAEPDLTPPGAGVAAREAAEPASGMEAGAPDPVAGHGAAAPPEEAAPEAPAPAGVSGLPDTAFGEAAEAGDAPGTATPPDPWDEAPATGPAAPDTAVPAEGPDPWDEAPAADVRSEPAESEEAGEAEEPGKADAPGGTGPARPHLSPVAGPPAAETPRIVNIFDSSAERRFSERLRSVAAEEEEEDADLPAADDPEAPWPPADRAAEDATPLRTGEPEPPAGEAAEPAPAPRNIFARREAPPAPEPQETEPAPGNIFARPETPPAAGPQETEPAPDNIFAAPPRERERPAGTGGRDSIFAPPPDEPEPAPEEPRPGGRVFARDEDGGGGDAVSAPSGAPPPWPGLDLPGAGPGDAPAPGGTGGNIFAEPADTEDAPQPAPEAPANPPAWPGLDLGEGQGAPASSSPEEGEPEDGRGGSRRFEDIVARYRAAGPEGAGGDGAGAAPGADTPWAETAPFQAEPALDAGLGAGTEEEERRLDRSVSPRELAELDGASNVPELLAAAAAWLSLVQGQTRFSRRDVMAVFDEIPGDHPRSLEARIKGYGKLVRNGVIILVDDGKFALSADERERYFQLLGATE